MSKHVPLCANDVFKTCIMSLQTSSQSQADNNMNIISQRTEHSTTQHGRFEKRSEVWVDNLMNA